MESKIRSKLVDLCKREAGIEGLESELKSKTEEAIKTVTQKEEEIIQLKDELKNLKIDVENEKVKSSNLLKVKDEKISQLEDQLRESKGKSDAYSINKLRLEVERRDSTLLEQERRIDKLQKAKEEWKRKYDQSLQQIAQANKQLEVWKQERIREQKDELERQQLEQKQREIDLAEKSNLTAIKKQLQHLANKSNALSESLNRDSNRDSDNIMSERQVLSDRNLNKQVSPKKIQPSEQIKSHDLNLN